MYIGDVMIVLRPFSLYRYTYLIIIVKSGIYRWTNIVNNKAYIGKAKDLKKRKRDFESNKTYTIEHSKIDRARRKYSLDKWNYEILEYCTEIELNEKEIYYIALYDTYNNGYNMTTGGDGNQNIVCTDETKNKLRDAIKRRPKEIQDKFIYGYDSSKPIVQYSLDGTYIKTWKYAREASKELNICASEIGGVCLGKFGRKTAGGFVFRFDGDAFDKYSIIHNKDVSPIEWIDDNGNLIKEFYSMTEAEKYFGKRLNISNVCKGLRNQTCGMKFRYKIN